MARVDVDRVAVVGVIMLECGLLTLLLLFHCDGGKQASTINTFVSG